MRPYVKALHARKLPASAIDLPRSKAERAVPVFIEKDPAGAIAGGHSYGGRVASMAAVEIRYKALILLSYPLHRPGHPEDLRTEHWPKIRCPVLLLSGEADPFARVELLRASVRLLPQGGAGDLSPGWSRPALRDRCRDGPGRGIRARLETLTMCTAPGDDQGPRPAAAAKEEERTLRAGDGAALREFVALPATGFRRGAVLLIHDIWGYTDFYKDLARRIRGHGQ